MNTNIILRKSTKVEGSITSETCEIGSSNGPSLSVTDEDVVITIMKDDGTPKIYKLSEVVEAILELDRRTAGIVEGPPDNSIAGDTTAGGTNPDGSE